MYRFCNVRRNDDAVTKWIHENYLHVSDWQGEQHLWFAIVVARLFNYPETLLDICQYVLPFQPEKMRRALHKRRNAGKKNFNGAYIVSTNGRAMDKVDYIIDLVLHPLWADRARLRLDRADTLESYHVTLCQYQGLGSFMAAQVVGDLKYTKPLSEASDWLPWAASGPGSRRGLNRVRGRPVDSPWNEDGWRAYFYAVWKTVNAKLKWKKALSGQDLQNCLCEFDKYERVRLGEGKPKQLYKESVI
jgi:hypothetical protein